MVRAQRALADVLIDGEWTPLVDATRRGVGGRACTCRGSGPSRRRCGRSSTAAPSTSRVTSSTPTATAAPSSTSPPARRSTGSGSRDHRAGAGRRRRAARRRRASRRRRRSCSLRQRARTRTAPTMHVPGPPAGARRRRPRSTSSAAARRRHRVVGRAPTRSTVRYRLRETGMYDGAPFVEEWKPLPPRLHADVSEQHTVEIGAVAVACVEVLGRRRRPAHRALTRRSTRVRSRRRSPPADRVRVAARRRRPGVPPRRAARVELDRERAQRRDHPLRHPQGRLRLPRPRARSGTSTADRGRPSSAPSCCSPASASTARPSIGFRLAWDLVTTRMRRRGR